MIEVNKLDPKFRYEVMRERGGEKISHCFTCGTCTASCPVNEVDEAFNPRKIIRMIVLGMKDNVLNSDFMWLCAGCSSCQERCPQGVSITDIMMALKNIAVRNGITHPAFQVQASEIYKFGRLYEVGDLNDRREKLELPRIPEKPEPIRKIYELIGIDKLVESEEINQE
ncbi:heterodisulfide reductase [bacterium]|nr:MAG: heterodisulfide reductase [bacterium]